MLKNEEQSASEEINFGKICEIINNSNKESLVLIEERVSNFLLCYYKKCEILSVKEMKDLNHFLNLITNKFIQEGDVFFVNILLIHFQNIPSSIINIKLKNNTFYVEEINNFFLSIFYLSLHLKNKKDEFSEKINYLIVSLINFMHLFLVTTLELAESKNFESFYIKTIIDSKIAETLINLYFYNELENEKVAYSFFLLTNFKEFDEIVIQCGILQTFIRLICSYSHTHYLITQTCINIVNRNVKILQVLISNDQKIINNILEKIYANLIEKCYDFNSINFLKLFFYIIEANCIDVNIFFKSEHYLNDNEYAFFNKLIKIIEYTESLIKDSSIVHILKEKNELFLDFFCILFCVLRNLIQLISSRSSKLCFQTMDVNSIENKKKEMSMNGKNLVNCALKFSLNFLVSSYHFSDEKKMLHSLCFDVVIGLSNNYFTNVVEHKEIFERAKKEIERIKETRISKGVSGIEEKNTHDNYLHVKYFEILFHTSFNEISSKEFLKEVFIIDIENCFYEIDKNMKLENIKKHESNNLLKLYYFGIIYIFIKNNFKSRRNLSFINYVIFEELKRKNFLLQNELFYKVFLQFLNMSIVNNLYEFKKFVKNDLFDDFLKIFKSSNFYFKAMILKILTIWVEKNIILEEIKKYLKKNKMIFTILLELWKELQRNNKNINPILNMSEVSNVRLTIFYIFKILTDNFTKNLNYFLKSEEISHCLRCIMAFEERSMLDIYSSIKEQILNKEIAVLESDILILDTKIEKCNEKVKYIEKRFENIVDANNKKYKNELESYYNYVREQFK